MSENPPPGFDEIHGSLTAPLLPSLEGSEVLAAPAPDVPTNPTLPTLDWNPTAPSGVESRPPPPPMPPAHPPAVSRPVDAAVAPTPEPPASVVVAAAVPPVASAPVPPGPAVGAAPVLAAPAEVAATAEAPGAPALPTVPPPVPAPPPASGMPPASASQFETPTAPPLATHRVSDAVGGIARTLVIAALVAAAVFGGRYAWDWNEDRQGGAAAIDVLPAAPVPAVDARFIVFRSGDGTLLTAHVDLSNGDYVAEVSDVTDLARRGDEYWMRDSASGQWVGASAEVLDSAFGARETVAEASLVMISDVLPVEAHPYVTVTADETVVLPGPTLPGPQVMEITEPGAPEQASDDRIVTGGNSDPLLDDVIDNIANPIIDAQAPAQPPNGASVPARHLTVTVDRLALQTADPTLAQMSGLSGTSPLVIEIWVDRTGVVRKLSMPSGTSQFPAQYELISASSDGLGPVADLGLPPLPVAPPEEVAQ